MAAPAFYIPLTILIEHSGFVTRDYRLVVLGLVSLVTGWMVAQSLERLGVCRVMGVNLTVIIMAVLATGHSLSRGLPGKELLLLLLVFVGVAAILWLRRPRLVNYVASWLALAMWLWVAAGLLQVVLSSGASLLSDRKELPVLQLEDLSGDVVVLILDEFPSLSFATSHLDLDGEAMKRSLEADGFTVEEAMPVSYAFTEMALPAFFLLDLPVGEGDTLSEATRSDLLAAVGGRNPFVQAFREAGYRITIVESGWSGLRCMETVDRCVVRSWYDEVSAAVLGRSVAGTVVNRVIGNPFSHGAERVMEWIGNDLPEIAGDNRDDLVVIHLMLPHTPIVFDAECEQRKQEPEPGVVALRRQIQCAQSVIQRVSTSTKGGLATVVMGDHGSKVLGQTEMPPEEWTEEMIAERMRTLVAIRGLEDCDEASARTSVNVSIRMLRCLGAEDVAFVPDVAFATSVHGEPLIDVYPP